MLGLEFPQTVWADWSCYTKYFLSGISPLSPPIFSHLFYLVPVLFLSSTLSFTMQSRWAFSPWLPPPTCLLKPKLYIQTVSGRVCVCETVRDRERQREGWEEMRQGPNMEHTDTWGWTTQISSSLHRQQTEMAWWRQNKHPIENEKYTVYKINSVNIWNFCPISLPDSVLYWQCSMYCNYLLFSHCVAVSL